MTPGGGPGDLTADPLFEPAFLRRLERVAVYARRALRGLGQGERRGRRHGGAVEFADTRGYVPGDDPRRIDWWAYARLESLLVRLYVEEQDLSLHVLLDRSASMATGTPPKDVHARRLAAALAWVGLAQGDRVTVRLFAGGEDDPPLGPLRGRAALHRLLASLAARGEAEGVTSLDDAARAFVARRPPTGVVLLISDLLDPAGLERPLARLRHGGHEVHVVHVLARDELAPEVGADVDLEDAETGEVQGVVLDQAGVAAYQAALARFLEGARRACAVQGAGYVLAPTDVPVEELVLDALRRAGIVR